MQSLGEQWSERTKKLVAQLERLGDEMAALMERRVNLFSAAIAFVFAGALMGYVLGLVHNYNKHEEELALGRACVNSVAEVDRIADELDRTVRGAMPQAKQMAELARIGKEVDGEKEGLLLGGGRLLAGQQPGVQEVPRIKGQGGR